MLIESGVLARGCAVVGGGTDHDRESMARAIADWRDLIRLRRANVVALLGDNSPQWLACDLGARAAGAVCVPLPPFFSDKQLHHVLEEAAADLVVADSTARLRSIEPAYRWVTTQQGLTVLHRAVRPRRSMPAGTAKITFTSGSTGTPKGVCLDDSASMRLATTLRDLLLPLGIERHLSVLPYATLLENVAGAYAALLAGARVAAPPLADLGFGGDRGFDPERFIAALNAWRPNSLILLPELLKGLVLMREFGARLPDSLKFVAVGGGKVGTELVERAIAVGIPVFEGYGLSECGSVVSLNLPSAQRPGSVGRVLPHVDVTLADDGEILVSGNPMLGYLGEPPAARQVGTGDLGEFDGEGYLYVRGRKKNQFVTAFGRNVNPEWPEAVLLQGPVLRQAAVFGEAMPGNVAVLVPMPGMSDAQVARAVTQANEQLPGYAAIHAWLRADQAFTTENDQATANARIRREAIEAAYRDRIQALGRVAGERTQHLQE